MQYLTAIFGSSSPRIDYGKLIPEDCWALICDKVEQREDLERTQYVCTIFHRVIKNNPLIWDKFTNNIPLPKGLSAKKFIYQNVVKSANDLSFRVETFILNCLYGDNQRLELWSIVSGSKIYELTCGDEENLNRFVYYTDRSEFYGYPEDTEFGIHLYITFEKVQLLKGKVYKINPVDAPEMHDINAFLLKNKIQELVIEANKKTLNAYS